MSELLLVSRPPWLRSLSLTCLTCLTATSLVAGAVACGGDDGAPGIEQSDATGAGGVGSDVGGSAAGGVDPDGTGTGGGVAEGGVGQTGGASAVGGTAGGVSTGGAGGTPVDPPTNGLPTLRPRQIRLEDPAVTPGPCAGPTDTAGVTERTLLVGQTHLLPVDSPFFVAAGDRPLTVAVDLRGAGPAPAITVTAAAAGTELGSVCLAGPGTLIPGGTLDARVALATLPAAWVVDGLELTVAVGNDAPTTTPIEVSTPAQVSLVVLDARLFGEGEPETISDDQLQEWLARFPASRLDVTFNPFGVWRPDHLLLGARSDGNSPTGDTIDHPPIVVDELPRCSNDDKTAGTCTTHSGFGTMSAVLGTLDGFRYANGLSSASTWYANHTVGFGGGLAGGQRGTGDDAGLIMNHELGHAWGFPHWGSSHPDYPYAGAVRDNGGFGDRWAYDQVTGELWAPECDGTERQSPMQRGNNCLLDGATWDPFSDYEAARLHRMLFGAEEVTGTVPYQGSNVPFTLPAVSGRQQTAWSEGTPGMELREYDADARAFVALEAQDVPWNAISEAEVPVRMFYGGAIRGGESYLEAPVDYVGNLLTAWDPADPGTLATMEENRNTWYWAHDVVIRFTLGDGTVLHRLLPGRFREGGDVTRFAVNVPLEVGAEVTKVEVVERPLGQYDEASRLPDDVTGYDYFAAATVVATFTP